MFFFCAINVVKCNKIIKMLNGKQNIDAYTFLRNIEPIFFYWTFEHMHAAFGDLFAVSRLCCVVNSYFHSIRFNSISLGHVANAYFE